MGIVGFRCSLNGHRETTSVSLVEPLWMWSQVARAGLAVVAIDFHSQRWLVHTKRCVERLIHNLSTDVHRSVSRSDDASWMGGGQILP